MRRLSLQIYLSVLLVLLLFFLLSALTWRMGVGPDHERQFFAGVEQAMAELLPGPERPRRELEVTLERLAPAFAVRATVRDAAGGLLASVGEPLPALASDRRESGVLHGRGHRGTAAIRLPGDRWLLLRRAEQWPDHGARGLGMVALLGVAIAGGAYPLVRRLTRRLERLQRRVDALGEGDLGARVEVEGADEVADLARSFNRAADRIEQLVSAQRSLLASASHELRSPLARMRVALELLDGEARPELRERISRDISELDDLIGEILLASRLESLDGLERSEQVELLPLVVEEAARCGAEVAGSELRLRGDARLLRRLVRNLLENARRHAAGSQIELSLEPGVDGEVRLRVEDRGPGVAEDERERIFEPFYRPRGTRETGEGFGLGLALVRQIARRHAGDVHCREREGGGSCFEVTLRGT